MNKAIFYYHFDFAESRRDRQELRNPSAIRPHEISPRDGCRSVAERELLAFLGTASELVGPELKSYLTEVWLDELACMECMPSPCSSDWRLVSEAASKRLFSCIFSDPSVIY